MKSIPVSKPWLGQEESEAAARAIQSGWVAQGPEVAAFEREFASVVRAPHACAVSNATTALHLALIAAGVKTGDEVVTVSHSFIATANSIRYTGAIPVFVDIEPDTFNIDPQRVADSIGPKTRAILCVHQLGMPCDLYSLLEISKKHRIPLIEDAACAIGSRVKIGVNWEPIGSPHGDVACFSLHPRKLLTTGEGGLITTRHRDWDALFRRLRHHGMNVSDLARHESNQVINESYTELGYNYRLSDIQAAVGRVQITRLEEILRDRRLQVERYINLLKEDDRFAFPVERPWSRSNWQSLCVRLPRGVTQREVMQGLLDSGISTRRGAMCAHREPSYGAGTFRASGELIQSERAQDECIILPLYHDLSTEDQVSVVTNLRRICGDSPGKRMAS